jgi:hypothetical protein
VVNYSREASTLWIPSAEFTVAAASQRRFATQMVPRPILANLAKPALVFTDVIELHGFNFVLRIFPRFENSRNVEVPAELVNSWTLNWR